MNKPASLLVLFALITSSVYPGTIIVEGKYQNKNLYIQNATSSNGVGFCAFEVLINGQVTTDEVTSKTFEIDFSALPIKPGADVIVEIRHKNDCSPKVLNPDVLKPHPTFEMVNIKVDNNGLLSWSTINEGEIIPFVIEQFRWNKWVKVGVVSGKGSKETNAYEFKTTLHSGINKFRVKQVGFNGEERLSKAVTVKSVMQPCTYKVKQDKSIQFSSETLFEVFDLYGNLIKYGYGSNVEMNDISKGTYFVCYDNIVAEYTR